MSADPAAVPVTVRYWASARAAAGTAEETVEVTGPLSLADVRRQVTARRPLGEVARFSKVLSCCSVLVGDRPVAGHDPEQVQVEPGQTVEFLPPFAGG